MTQYPRKGDFRVLKSKNIPGERIPLDTPKGLRLRRSFVKSVSIYPGSAPGVCVYVHVVVWLKFYFPLFWGMVIYDNEFKKKNIGVSLLWSPIRKSRVKALIKLRIFSEHLLGNNLKLQANFEHYF